MPLHKNKALLKASFVAYAITHITGRARLWGVEEWPVTCASFQAFDAELHEVVAPPKML